MRVRSAMGAAAVLCLVLTAACSDPAQPGLDPRSHAPAEASTAGQTDSETSGAALEVDDTAPDAIAQGGRFEPAEGGRVRDEDGTVLCFKPVASSRNTVPMQVKVEPATVGVGDVVRVLVRTAPGLLVGASMEFSDNEPHGGFGPPSRSDDEGVWRMVWTIAPDVPPGPARVMVAAGSTQGEGATGEARFTVRGRWAGGCE